MERLLMTWGESIFLGESYLNWAQLLGGVSVLAGGAAVVWRLLRHRRAPNAVTMTQYAAAETDRRDSDTLAKAIVLAPVVYVAAEAAAQILREKLREHSLDAIAAGAPIAMDPAISGLATAAALIADGDSDSASDLLSLF